MGQIAFYVFSPHKYENVNSTPWLSVVILNLFVLWLNPKTTVSIGFEMRLPCLGDAHHDAFVQCVSPTLILEKFNIFLLKILIFFPDTQATSFHKSIGLIMW